MFYTFHRPALSNTQSPVILLGILVVITPGLWSTKLVGAIWQFADLNCRLCLKSFFVDVLRKKAFQPGGFSIIYLSIDGEVSRVIHSDYVMHWFRNGGGWSGRNKPGDIWNILSENGAGTSAKPIFSRQRKNFANLEYKIKCF